MHNIYEHDRDGDFVSGKKLQAAKNMATQLNANILFDIIKEWTLRGSYDVVLPTHAMQGCKLQEPSGKSPLACTHMHTPVGAAPAPARSGPAPRLALADTLHSKLRLQQTSPSLCREAPRAARSHRTATRQTRNKVSASPAASCFESVLQIDLATTDTNSAHKGAREG